MKAVLFHKHGGPEVLEYGDFPTPAPEAGQVLVRLKAAALNRLDEWVRNGWPGIKLEYPHIPGGDGAGVVEAVGAGVTRFQPGHRVVIDGTLSDDACEFCRRGLNNQCVKYGVLGEHGRGTYAEYIALPERNLLRVPEHVPFETAAAASLVFLTAWHSLITRGGLTRGESVLVVGAGGGVNTASIQIAKRLGCTVYVVGSDEHKLAQAQSLGAEVLIDRSKEDWGKKVFQLTDKRGVDVVVDNVGAATLMTSLRAVRRGGRVLTVGNTSGPKFEFDNRFMFGKHISFIGSTMGTHADFAAVMPLVFDGTFRVPIDSSFPLTEARAAHEKMGRGEFFGKIVLSI
ncbi:MAG: zinc-binding dehydrogenase [Chloroflexi bacterium]|nr:zinc-binding dehydrogenase [Chloroflexota bacterium]